MSSLCVCFCIVFYFLLCSAAEAAPVHKHTHKKLCVSSNVLEGACRSRVLGCGAFVTRGAGGEIPVAMSIEAL